MVSLGCSLFYSTLNYFYRTSFFLIGFYTLALVCAVLILKFGVLPAINPPNQTLVGMFVLSATIAGVAGGGIAIFFWKAAIYGIGAWGGFAFALWIQSFHDGGVIKSTSFRWILYISITFLLLLYNFLSSLLYEQAVPSLVSRCAQFQR
jgi:hypothetical protein